MISSKLIEAAVNWWTDQITGNKMNWDNGAQNEGNREEREIGTMMFLLGNLTALNARQTITKKQIETFKTTLGRLLKERSDRGDIRISLHCDYGPGEILYEAAEAAQIDGYAFPCKTAMWIDEHQVQTKLGYGADTKILITE